ncbi:hypothetical protein GCM10009851_35310 [Herbiconiux moechotypicola]|uniref:MmyB-like transcription regulator ligand binding domain-containing protein n=1 Tax=Herbiconiux moechotypicola TaxID=637393 RepID=A0ABN3E1X7_9MICO
MLGFWPSLPAVVCDRRLTVLASTPLARALSEAFEPGENLVRFVFLSPRRRESSEHWASSAQATVGLLHGTVDERDPDRRTERMLGEVSTHSRGFSQLWADPRVLPPQTGTVAIEDTAAGDVLLHFAVLDGPRPADTLVIVFAPADDPARQALSRLALSSSSPDRRAR